MVKTARGTRTAIYVGSGDGGDRKEPIKKRGSSCSTTERKVKE